MSTSQNVCCDLHTSSSAERDLGLDLMDLSPIDIAQQLTLIDHRLFGMVRDYELIGFSSFFYLN